MGQLSGKRSMGTLTHWWLDNINHSVRVLKFVGMNIIDFKLSHLFVRKVFTYLFAAKNPKATSEWKNHLFSETFPQIQCTWALSSEQISLSTKHAISEIGWQNTVIAARGSRARS